MSTKPRDYRGIAAWHAGSSMGYYIKNLQEEAANEGAPLTAIYRQGDGEWATMEDVINTDAVRRCCLWLLNN